MANLIQKLKGRGFIVIDEHGWNWKTFKRTQIRDDELRYM